MDALQAVISRRSIRKYTETPITDEQLKRLLEAGMCAPTAKNKHPWHFVVIKDKQILEKFIEVHPHGSMLRYAYCGILVCGDKELAEPAPNDSYLVLDCAAATTNILTAAAAMGLGACWIGVMPREDRMKAIAELLHLPDNIVPVSVVSVGNTDVVKDPVDRWKPERVHYEQW